MAHFDPEDADEPRIFGPDFTDLDLPLGISRKVTLSTVAPPGRVPDTYFHAWPIRTVLRRWRRRGGADERGTTFHGARLFPSLWAVLHAMHERHPDLRGLDARALSALQRKVLDEDRCAEGCATAVDSQSLYALVGYLSLRNRLSTLQQPWPLVPDLLLYKRTDQRVHGLRFVNVKQHDSHLWSQEVDDLRRLRACGVRAGIWRFASGPKGTPAKLRAARRRYMPTREERRARQIRGFFPWGDVEPCRGHVPATRPWGREPQLEGPPVAEEGCLGCGRPPSELEWVYFRSPSWTWARLCGRAGWLAICPDCQHQVDFRMTCMN